VGRHIFEKCIRGILHDKCVILATNQVQFLEPASQILVLRNGRVSSRGSFAELKVSGELSSAGDGDNTVFAIDEDELIAESVTSMQSVSDFKKIKV